MTLNTTGSVSFRIGLPTTIALIPGVTVIGVSRPAIYAFTFVGYRGEMTELEQNIRFGVELAVKSTVLVRVKCVRRVPLPDVEIIVPSPAPGGTGGPLLAASLMRVCPGYPGNELTTSGAEVNCWSGFNPEPVLSITTDRKPPLYIEELSRNPN
jgi:hypothetical protein